MITVTLKPIKRKPNGRPPIERIPFPEIRERGIQFLANPDATTRAKRRVVLTGEISQVIAQRFGDRAIIKNRVSNKPIRRSS